MAVKITANGIDKVQDGTVHTQTIINGSISYDDLPSGSCLQMQFANSNTQYPNIGVNTVVEEPYVDITLVTRGDNSSFKVYGQISQNDTNSNSFGVGVGVRVYSNGVYQSEPVIPARHEDYLSGAYDTYRVARHVTEFPLSYPKGTSLTFRLTARSNNLNTQAFLGNGTPYYCMRQIVQEIKA